MAHHPHSHGPHKQWDPHAVVWKPMPVVEVKKAGDPNASWVKQRFVVDSGGWRSVVPHKLGKQMGFRRHPGEKVHHYETVGPGHASYLNRTMELKAGSLPAVSVPVAWSTSNTARPALGRDGVFDMYDVTLSEAHDRITFTPRKGTPGYTPQGQHI
eukprot:Sspe_Gene.27862::Locus_12271_Transcript_1_1_Confidence_1.000_Length_1730::g.27862::m.27862